MDPILIVLAFSTLAALTAPLGVLPLTGREITPVRWIGWSNALAAGFMLGAAFVIGETALGYDPSWAAAGGIAGIAFIYWTHRVSGAAELDLNALESAEPAYGYRVLLVSGLHGASEGVAIGVAMLESIPFGILVAVAMAVHNVPEATILGSVLRGTGVRLSHAAGLSVATNVSQVLLAVGTFAVVPALAGSFPVALGFAVGALTYLAMSELLPQAYDQGGKVGIAFVTLVAMGFVVVLKGFVG
jgi:zinc transporter ZupT